MMKFMLVVCFVVLAGSSLAVELPEEVKEMLEQIQQTCEKEHNVPAEMVEQAKKEMHLPDDPNFKCFLKCMMVHMDAMTPEGEFTAEKALEHIPDEIKQMGVDKIVEKCQGKKGSDGCGTAYELIKCFAHESKELGELFT